mmetsp:Transcript_3185/g.8791  ORF Transcript_3185/g.8791 Transcript_3185/m.8791 type:complete len:312 (+) Transcript_3185:418-1353(+)
MTLITRPSLMRVALTLCVLGAICLDIDAFSSRSNPSLFTMAQRHYPRHLQAQDITQENYHASRLQMSSYPTENEKKKSESAADSQNVFGIVSDTVTGIIFNLLHAFDECDIKDSSKNLRVLWVRALLNYRGKIQDSVAQELLPKTTRGLVTSEWGASLLDPILKFAEWIQARTEFIDEALDNFLSSPACTDAEGTDLECNVVLFGAGYDTRALRYRHRHSGMINFVEVDLPEVVEGKSKLYQQFRRTNDPEWSMSDRHNLVPFDLNDCGGQNPTSLIQTLRKEANLKENVPTLMVWEAGKCITETQFGVLL